MRLLPRQEKFYHLFFEQASIIEQAAQTLLDGVRRGNSHLADVAEKIRQLENKGDNSKTRATMSFMTSFSA